MLRSIQEKYYPIGRVDSQSPMGTIRKQETVAIDTKIFILMIKQKTVLITLALAASVGWGSTSEAAMNTKSKSPLSQNQEAVAPDTSMAYVPILLASGVVIGLAVGAGTFLHKLKFRNHEVTPKTMTEQD